VAALNQTRRNAVLLVALLFAQLLLMSSSVRGGKRTTVLESWTVTLTSPVMAVANGVAGGLRGLIDGSRALFQAHSRNAALEGELSQLREELRLRREAALENARLRRLLVMRDEVDAPSIGAAVVTANLSGQVRLIVIDRGTRDGVTTDLPVIADGVAVGRVVAAFRNHAKVRLLTDPNSGVAGVTQRGRAQGVVLGQGRQALAMLYVPRYSDVTQGDRVVTSGLDGVFPRGMGIGRVTSVQTDPAGTQTILLEPEMDYRSLEEVLVVLEASGGGVLDSPAPVGGE